MAPASLSTANLLPSWRERCCGAQSYQGCGSPARGACVRWQAAAAAAALLQQRRQLPWNGTPFNAAVLRPPRCGLGHTALIRPAIIWWCCRAWWRARATT